MAEVNETDFEARYNHATTGLFKTNTSNAIASDDLRDLVTYIKDSALFAKSDRYTIFQQFTTTTSTTAYVGTTNPAITAYATGQIFQVKAHATSTGAVTLNLNTLGAKKWYVDPTTQATTGDIVINTIYIVAYDATLDSGTGGLIMIAGGGGGGGGSSAWGGITGTITDQTDLVSYVASAVAGLMDYRGVFDASVNAYPSSGGSGTAGAILKSDFWIVSVAGTLPTGLVVAPGDLIIAKQDTPGNTEANWSLVEYNIGYTPENAANKDTDATFAANSDTKYPSQKAVKTALDLKAPLASPALTGTPTAPTPTQGDNSTKLATTAYVDAASAANKLFLYYNFI